MSVVFARAPLRVSLGGGGTDLPSWYREKGGHVVSATIDKHVYMLVNTTFQRSFVVKHLEWEEVHDPAQLRHPILREVIRRHWRGGPLELSSVADVPPGTGLGSSGAYAVCSVQALALARGDQLAPRELAEAACEIEIDVLERTVGKQDQYAAAHGGLNAYAFEPDGSVRVRPLALDPEVLAALERDLVLFFTGEVRSASDILADQVQRTAAGDGSMAANLERATELGRRAGELLEAGDLSGFGACMNEQWEVKRGRAPGAITPRLDRLRERALAAGAGGAMLVGAGGGGFLLCYAEQPDELRRAMREEGTEELPFAFSDRGCEGSVYG